MATAMYVPTVSQIWRDTQERLLVNFAPGAVIPINPGGRPHYVEVPDAPRGSACHGCGARVVRYGRCAYCGNDR
jgi:hypothetical protein